MIVGENGVVSQAQDSKIRTETASAQEAVDMALGAMTAEFMGDVWPSNTGANIGDLATVGKFKEEVENNGYELDTTDLNENDTIINKEIKIYKEGSSANISTFEITASTDGTSLIGTKKETTTSNNSGGEVVATADAGRNVTTSNRTLSGSTNKADMTYKNPVIPQGFKPKETATASWSYVNTTTLDEVSGWDNGLVIEDNTNHNEFVWVPCTTGTSDDVVTYSKNFANYPKSSSIISVSDATSDNTDQTSSGDTTIYSAIPVIAENAQIGTYGGFYVARYEAGLAGASSNSTNNNYDNVPVSVAGTRIWNNIDYTHSYVAAEKMVSGTAYGYNKSGLITGTQWDTIMQWFEKSGIKVTGTTGSAQDWGTYDDLSYNGTGNYFIYTSSAGAWTNGEFSHPDTNNTSYKHYHASGLNSNGYQKNIADLGGNVYEWTAEVYSSGRVFRGGNAYTSVASFPASYRNNNAFSNTNYFIGFRGVLYVSDTAQ